MMSIRRPLMRASQAMARTRGLSAGDKAGFLLPGNKLLNHANVLNPILVEQVPDPFVMHSEHHHL